MAKKTKAPKVLKDLRVDLICFLGQLYGHFLGKGDKDQIKAEMDRRGAIVVEGIFCRGVLKPRRESTIDPRELWAMKQDGQITEAQFFASIDVNADRLGGFVEKKTIDGMKKWSDGKPSLWTDTIDGKIDIVRALRHLGEELARRQKAAA